MSGPKSVLTRLETQYRRYGLSGVLDFLPGLIGQLGRSAVAELITELLYRKQQNSIIDRTEIESVVADEQIFQYGEAETVDIDPSSQDLPDSFQAATRGFHRPRPKGFELRDSKLLWRGSPALSADDELILESSENSRAILRYRIKSAVSEYGPATVYSDISGNVSDSAETDQPLFLLVRHPSTNYYHWLLDYLPKIIAFEKYNRKYETEANLLVEADPPDWASESLSLMGYDENTRQWVGESATVDSLIIPQHQSQTPQTPHLPSPYECEFVKTRVAGQVSATESADRIFVSRQDATDRQIRNMDAVRRVLADYGFEICTPGQMSVEEQVGLFEQADTVAGVHGAGMTNIIFGNELSVLEIFPRSGIREHYFYLSEIFGHEYHYHLAEPAGADVIVDVESLRAFLDEQLPTTAEGC